GEAGVVAPGDKPIHGAPIDLRLLVEETVNEVARLVVWMESRVLQDVVGLQGVEPGVKTRIDCPRVDRRWRRGQAQRSGDKAERLPDLRAERLVESVGLIQRRGRGLSNAVGSGEQAIQGVEAPVLLVDHDNVLDLAQLRVALVFCPESVGCNQTEED